MEISTASLEDITGEGKQDEVYGLVMKDDGFAIRAWSRMNCMDG